MTATMAPDPDALMPHGHRPLPVASGAGVRRTLARLVGRHRGVAAAAAVAVVAWTITGQIVPLLLGSVVDLVADGSPIEALAVPLLAIAGLVLLGGVFGFAADVLVARAGAGIVTDLRDDVVERAMTMPTDRLEAAGAGDLVARVGDDVALVTGSIERVLPTLAFAGLSIVFTIAGLAWLDPRYAVAAAAAVPIQVISLRWYVRRCIPIYAAARAADAVQAEQILGTLAARRTIRAFRLREREQGRVARRSSEANDLDYAGTVIQTRLYGGLNLAEFVAVAVVLTIGFALVGAGQSTIGAATAAAIYVHRSFDPVGAVLTLIDDVLVAGAGLARLVGILEVDAAPPGEAGHDPGRGTIDIAGLEQRYDDGPPVLHGVDLRVAPGERLAVVGPSGAGKSTLARVVAGALPATRGTVVVDGVCLTASPPTRAAGVCLVTQEVHVFAGTLADDLRLADPAADDVRLRDALAVVGADWVDRLPDGLATVVGAGGATLTPAQAQQVALARAWLADRPILILDEATAEAESADAGRIDIAAAAVARGRTTVVIAHRLGQAATADRIVVLEDGRIRQVGRHEDLIAVPGSYRRAWEAWMVGRTTPRGERRRDGTY